MIVKQVKPIKDSTGKLIQLHDVLRDDESGETVFVAYGVSLEGVRGLLVQNNVAEIYDWLDVYPEGFWTIVGNFGTVREDY